MVVAADVFDVRKTRCEKASSIAMAWVRDVFTIQLTNYGFYRELPIDNYRLWERQYTKKQKSPIWKENKIFLTLIEKRYFLDIFGVKAPSKIDYQKRGCY